jgi:hypothetical protein
MKSILTIVFTSIVLLSQAQTSVRDLEKYLDEIKTKPYTSLPVAILEDTKNQDKQIKLLQSRLNDSLQIVRSRSYYIIKIIGKKSKNTNVRQTAVNLLVKGIGDKDTGISGNNSEALNGFEISDFTKDAQEELTQSLKVGTAHLNQLIKLIGYLNLKEQKTKLEEMISSNASAGDKWACYLALARMGETFAIDFILDKVKNAEVNDKLIYGVVPDLVYTKQKVIFDYLVSVINLDTPTCQSANPDSNAKILCGYRVMEEIAPAIKSYPVAVDDFGDLKVTDYEKALVDVRQWFAANPNYEINSNIY